MARVVLFQIHLGSGTARIRIHNTSHMHRIILFQIIFDSYCATKAIFYCPTMNSHRPRSQNTAKEQALIPEKDSKRIRPRCRVSLEKSSKNYKPMEKWAKPNLLPDVTPQPANFSGDYFRQICHVVEPIRQNYLLFFLATQDGQNRGEGGVIHGLI